MYKYSGSVAVMLQKDLGITAFHKLNITLAKESGLIQNFV